MIILPSLAILAVDSQSSAAPFPAVILPNLDWADLMSKAIFFVVWAVISIFVMRAILYGYRWSTAGTNEEYSDWSKAAFIQSTSFVIFLSLLLITISVLKDILGVT